MAANMHCTLIVSADVRIMKIWKGVSEACLNPLKTYVRKCQWGTEPEIWVGSGHRRAEAPLASTSWQNCILQLSLFSVCFSFLIFTTEAHLPATNQTRTQSQARLGQQHPTVTSLQLGRYGCGAEHAMIRRVWFISGPALRVLQLGSHW